MARDLRAAGGALEKLHTKEVVPGSRAKWWNRGMALVKELEARIKTAMRARDEAAKSILRVALGEIQLAESRAGEPLPDDAAHKVLRKLVASNQATLDVTVDEAGRAKLIAENRLLEELLPRQLGVDELVALLAPVADALRAAKADGPAMGAAMKHLKQSGAAADGGDVRAAVQRIRAGG